MDLAGAERIGYRAYHTGESLPAQTHAHDIAFKNLPAFLVLKPRAFQYKPVPVPGAPHRPAVPVVFIGVALAQKHRKKALIAAIIHLLFFRVPGAEPNFFHSNSRSDS